ncbi:hypothetical protein KAJ83_10765 [Marivibrio halodurans]|uniref:Uncharacterized protein n=1 Tax=Marivibrio halodurans TaxID=2039722 RepID=A0A8J7V168_9PROT|nr:biotin carboxylase N-terminal domain-containing protein [Marivibrio halodurans]MBP5857491.1 hypothetical protein [Marivibrio halodurans]
MFRRILIANRGEIARRVARTCRRLGIDYVAVYSEADRDAPHLDGAIASIPIGPAAAAQSYLDAEKLITVARDTGCEAVHPGYGFLSENAAFAAAVEAAGLTFIGPTPKTIADMGDKATAKRLMAAAGVPTVPGSEGASDDPVEIEAALAEVGFPALLKPVAGGGGKGMAVIRSGDGRAAIDSAIRTARSGFGDGRLLVERYVTAPRHVEVQVFGDGTGEVVHLHERECSLQRRHQKVVEEAPAAFLSDDLRARLLDAATRGARAIAYRNAGTFEFIVGADGAFFFLEVNTRLQVEHPVTEEITGLDLVEWQLRIAAGEGLPRTQAAIQASGHAIECRLYAEDPAAAFRPAPGTVAALRWPEGVRVESAIRAGGSVPPDYDPMIAKLIVHGADRDAALARMRAALAETAILGLTTNHGFLARLLADPVVQADGADTGFVDEALPRLVEMPDAHDILAVAAAALACPVVGEGPNSPWHGPGLGDIGGDLGGGRGALDPVAPMGRVGFVMDGKWRIARFRAIDAGYAVIDVGGEDGGAGAGAVRLRSVTMHRDGDLVRGMLAGRSWVAAVGAEAIEIAIAGTRARVERALEALDGAAGGDGAVASEMPGVVVALRVAVGDIVARGDTLAIVEAMKFETPIAAPRDGIVAEIDCAVGTSVRAGQILIQIGEAGEAAGA